MSTSLGRFRGARQREQVEVHRTPYMRVFIDQPKARPRGEAVVRVFEHVAAALLALWLVGTAVSAVDQMLAPAPAVYIGPDAEPWP